MCCPPAGSGTHLCLASDVPVMYQRLSKGYEELPKTSEALIYLAMSQLMVKRLAHG
jgi:hypothetical protein